jgi:tetratricopeptide (TPR) repeat protein
MKDFLFELTGCVLSQADDAMVSSASIFYINNDKQKAEDMVREKLDYYKNNGRKEYAAGLCLKVAIVLFNINDYGRSIDIALKAANYYSDLGFIDISSKIYKYFGDNLFLIKNHGWAGSQYYCSAMVYIESGRIDDALLILKEVREKFELDQNKSPWMGWLIENINLLEDKSLSDDKKLYQLQSFFEKNQRYSWAESCSKGRYAVLSKESNNIFVKKDGIDGDGGTGGFVVNALLPVQNLMRFVFSY